VLSVDIEERVYISVYCFILPAVSDVTGTSGVGCQSVLGNTGKTILFGVDGVRDQTYNTEDTGISRAVGPVGLTRVFGSSGSVGTVVESSPSVTQYAGVYIFYSKQGK